MDKEQKGMAQFLAKSVLSKLAKRKKINLTVDEQEAVKLVTEIIYKDFHAEELLNEKVREILKEHNKELQSSNVDYKKMFNMIKRRLIEEQEIDL